MGKVKDILNPQGLLKPGKVLADLQEGCFKFTSTVVVVFLELDRCVKAKATTNGLV
jgi:hypothetical protein